MRAKASMTKSQMDEIAPFSAADVRARAARMLAELESRQRGDADAAADWLKVALEFQEASGKKPQAPRTAADLLAS
jgi:hypothetical protein